MLRGSILGSTLRGAKGLNGIAGGWLREVRANDTNPALLTNQAGPGKTFDFQRGGSSVLEADGSYLWIRHVARLLSTLDIRKADDSDYVLRLQNTNTLLGIYGQTAGAITALIQAAPGQIAALQRFSAPASWGANPLGLLAWRDTDGSTDRTLLTHLGLLKIRHFLLSSLPTPGPDYRSQLAVVEGAEGALDALYICRKLANDTYDWKEVTVQA